MNYETMDAMIKKIKDLEKLAKNHAQKEGVASFPKALSEGKSTAYNRCLDIIKHAYLKSNNLISCEVCHGEGWVHDPGGWDDPPYSDICHGCIDNPKGTCCPTCTSSLPSSAWDISEEICICPTCKLIWNYNES